MKLFLCAIVALMMVLSVGCGAGLLSEPPFSSAPSMPGYAPDEPSPDGPGYSGTATTYYNACLGLSVQVLPQDYIVELNAAHLGVDAGTCATLDDFEWQDAGEGFQATLLIMTSGDDPTDSEHAGMWLFAEYCPAWTFDEYIEEFAYWLDEDTYDSQYTLEEYETVRIGERDYTRLVTRVDSLEGHDTYYEEYYVTPAGGCYLIVEVDYWADNSISHADALAYLERFGLGDAEPDIGGIFNA